MSLQSTSRRLARSIFSVLFLASINSGIAQAQVIPDGTLPTNIEALEMILKITGGERVGDNLFHSFEEFSIPEGMSAIFKNALDIQNIFTRITGSEISFIDGLLQTQGGANFFLVNPNGIVFGENAQIDVGGSFIATTANSIEFADGTSFIASGDEPKVTLTISVPIGLGLYGNNGSITVNGQGNQIKNDSIFAPIEFGQQPTGLSIPNGQTIALIGNGVDFNGGVVTTEGGNIYISSVESGSVGISQAENGLTLLNDQVNNYQDINLHGQSLIDASGDRVGNIFVSGQNINLFDGSFVLARNQGSLSGSEISIKAHESINLSRASPDGEISSNIQSEALNTGEGANVNISAEQLTIQDDGRIQANTFSDGASGNLNFKVSNSIEVNNSRIGSRNSAAGNAGNIDLSTSQLRVVNFGVIASNSGISATGNGGEIIIKAEEVEILGESASTPTRSIIASSSFSTVDNPGNAGKLTINTARLRITKGASLSSSSFAFGNAGDLIINASESINISGQNPEFQGSSNSSSTIRTAVQASTFPGSGLPSIPTGDSGSLTINTPSLNISQAGVITVENQGTGSAGKLEINADTLNLDQTGRITAAAESGLGGEIFLNTQNLNISNDSEITATAGGEGEGGNVTINTTNLTAKKNNNITASANLGGGGNITINADNSLSLKNQDAIAATSVSADGGNISLNTDQLQLDNDSQISTSAEGLGDGGNITINSNIFTALNNSQVTANAIKGNGGNISINTEGYFVSNNFVISASSQFGLDGTITINAPDNNFQKDLELPNYQVVALPDFYTPRCENPDRARISIDSGKYLAEDADNYFSSPGTLSGDLPPELEAKLEQMKQEFDQATPPTDWLKNAPDGAYKLPNRIRGTAPYESELNPSLAPEKKSNLLWQPGEPIANATEVTLTSDGRIFLVLPDEKPNQELLCPQRKLNL